MSKPFDATLKHLLEAYPADWLRLAGVTPRGPVEPVEGDVSTVSAQADKVFRLTEPAPWLIHLEVQASYDADLAERTHLYNTLLSRRHSVPVRSVALLLLRQASGRGVTGILRRRDPLSREYLAFRYDVVRVWRLPAGDLLRGGVGTLPLAPLTDDAAPDLPQVVREVRRRVEGELNPTEAASFWTATYVLMGLRHPPEVAQALFREVPRMEESATYQEIVAKGLVKGQTQGRIEAARDLLLDLGTLKFGKPGAAVRRRVGAIDEYVRLKALSERLLTAESWSELFEEA